MPENGVERKPTVRSISLTRNQTDNARAEKLRDGVSEYTAAKHNSVCFVMKCFALAGKVLVILVIEVTCVKYVAAGPTLLTLAELPKTPFPF